MARQRNNRTTRLAPPIRHTRMVPSRHRSTTRNRVPTPRRCRRRTSSSRNRTPRLRTQTAEPRRLAPINTPYPTHPNATRPNNASPYNPKRTANTRGLPTCAEEPRLSVGGAPLWWRSPHVCGGTPHVCGGTPLDMCWQYGLDIGLPTCAEEPVDLDQVGRIAESVSPRVRRNPS